MRDVVVLAIRGLAGGVLVCAFSLLGQASSPKAFSGLFSAAPSVAIASLTVTVLAESSRTARQDSIGMVVGGIGMAACCVLAAVAIPRVRSLWGSLISWFGWAVVAFSLYWAVFVGAH